MKTKGDLKKLIRNLRIKKNEETIHIGNAIAFSKREKGKKD